MPKLVCNCSEPQKKKLKRADLVGWLVVVGLVIGAVLVQGGR